MKSLLNIFLSVWQRLTTKPALPERGAAVAASATSAFSGATPAFRRLTTARQSGFSLVEVVMAIGVVSVGLVAILGVLPAGLEAARNSASETRAAQLAQTVFTTLKAQPYEDIDLFGERIDLSNAPALVSLSANTFNLSPTNIALPDAAYFMELSFDEQPGISQQDATLVRLVVTWPPKEWNRKIFVTLIPRTR